MKRPVFGFGHAVLRAEDPRAIVQFALGEEICPDDEYYRIIRVLAKLLQWYFQTIQNQQSKRNVDIASGTLLNMLDCRP